MYNLSNYTKGDVMSIDFIEKLSNARGISGFEEEVLEVIKKELNNDFVYETNSILNMTIKNKNFDPNKKTIILDGHSDEIGFMVQGINERGLIKFIPIGGWVDNNVTAQKVLVRNNKGEYIEGIVASKPPHFMTSEERNRAISINDLYIDIGAVSRVEVEEVFGIEIGAPIVPFAKFTYNKISKILMGKGFDNRLGCALVVEVLKYFKDINLPFNLVGTISSQEEIGSRGAQVTVKDLNAHMAIVFEGSPADDTHTEEYMIQGGIKRGTQIRLMDRSMVTNPRLAKYIKDTATKYNIKNQKTVRTGGGTNAGIFALGKNSVPSIVLGVPVRYAHTHYGISALEDYENTKELAIKAIEDLTTDILNSL